MTPAQLQQFNQLITAGKFGPERDKPEYPFQRGWNGALEFVEDGLKRILNAEETKNDT